MLPPRVLLLDIDPARAELFAEWLAAEGMAADTDTDPESAAAPTASLILIDLPFPRQDGRERLAQVRGMWPGVPIVMLSSTLLPGVSPQGEVARSLGAAAVLPSPVARKALCSAVLHLVNS